MRPPQPTPHRRAARTVGAARRADRWGSAVVLAVVVACGLLTRDRTRGIDEGVLHRTWAATLALVLLTHAAKELVRSRWGTDARGAAAAVQLSGVRLLFILFLLLATADTASQVRPPARDQLVRVSGVVRRAWRPRRIPGVTIEIASAQPLPVPDFGSARREGDSYIGYIRVERPSGRYGVPLERLFAPGSVIEADVYHQKAWALRLGADTIVAYERAAPAAMKWDRRRAGNTVLLLGWLAAGLLAVLTSATAIELRRASRVGTAVPRAA